MSIEDFSEAMIHTVTHKSRTGSDEYSAPTYGSGTSYSARVVYKSKWIRMKDGSEILAKGEVWFMGTPDVEADDQVVLPDSTTPPILLVEKFSDTTGPHHTKVYFG